MSKWMVLANCRGVAYHYGTFDAMMEAKSMVEAARVVDRTRPLEWEMRDDSWNELGFYTMLTAWDGTSTTRFFLVEVNEPPQSLDVMVEEAWNPMAYDNDEFNESWDKILGADSEELLLVEED